MQPRIEILPERKLVGKRIKMSFAENRATELWKSFMPRRSEVKSVNSDLYSVEIYPQDFFKEFNPTVQFEKWAAVEVADYREICDDFETLDLPSGKYAVFIHKGPASEGEKTYRYIFENWIPNSGYLLDDRPHFALMGEKYKHEQPESEEEIWIPVKAK